MYSNVQVLTFGELEGFATTVKRAHQFSEATIEKALTDSTNKDVFLAHSSQDKKHLEGFLDFFRQFNATLYLDIHDKTLKMPPSHQTAITLMNAIRSCNRMVVLMSKNSATSKWIPWEVGIGQVTKGIPNVAILPIAERADDKDWEYQEYMNLCPIITRVTENGSSNWAVLIPGKATYINLKTWLTSDQSKML